MEITRSAARKLHLQNIANMSDTAVLDALVRNGNLAVTSRGETQRTATQSAADYRNETLSRRLF